MAYVVQSLTEKDASIRAAGTVKASWIADVFGLSLRSVKGARKALIESGLITKDTGSFQRKSEPRWRIFSGEFGLARRKRRGAKNCTPCPKKAAQFCTPI